MDAFVEGRNSADEVSVVRGLEEAPSSVFIRVPYKHTWLDFTAEFCAVMDVYIRR